MEQLLRSKLREQKRGDFCGPCCTEAVAAFIENKLGSAEREQVAYHLSLCQSCRDTLALAGRVNGVTRQAQAHQPRLRIAWLAAAVALLCLCTATVYLQSGIRPKVRQEPLPQLASTANVSHAKDSYRINEHRLSQGKTGPTRTVSPLLAEAVIGAPGIDNAGTIWRVDTVRYPAALEMSQDGGRTWKQANISGFQAKFVIWNATKVLAINSHGVIMQSTDNGNHWTRLQHIVHTPPTP
jgi:hypothetical protein